MAIVGNNDTVTSGFNTAFSWEHTLHTSDSAVCPANATLDSVNIRSESTSGTSATIELGIYDVTSGAGGAALLHTETVTVDRTSAGVYSVTGLGVDFSAHSGKTLAIAHCKPSSSTIDCARIAATGNPRSAASDTTLDNPFAENDTNGATVYGLWAEITEPTSETATTGNIPLVIQAGYTLVDLVDPVTTDASILFGVTGDTPVTGDHLEYDVTSTLDSGVTLSVAATGVWTVTEAVEGDWVTDITVSRRVVQADGTIGTEAVVTLQAATGLTVIGGMVSAMVSNIVSNMVN